MKLKMQDRLDTFFHETIHALERRPGLNKLAILVEGLRDSLFGGSERTVKEAPYIRDSLGMQRYMLMPIIACMPAALASIYFFGWRAFLIIVVSYVAGGIAELVFSAIRRVEITEGFLVTGILYALSVPAHLPLWIVALGVIVGVALGKEIFGGTGYNIFNPALVGRAFLLLSFPRYMIPNGEIPWYEPFWPKDLSQIFGGFAQWAPDAVTAATPLVRMKFDHVETPLWQLLFGNHAGSMGETSAILLLLGGLFLLFTRIIDWRVSVVMIATVGALQWLLGIIFPAKFVGVWYFHILSGGLLFAAFLNATDPVTSPMTPRGKIIFGISLGALTVLIRALTGYAEGVTFAVLIGNMFTPLLDRFTVPKSFGGKVAQRR